MDPTKEPGKVIKLNKYMFTGIIQHVGRVKSLKTSGMSIRLEIESKDAVRDLNIGDSIAVNGVCLTAASKSRNSFTADVSSETLKMTSLGGLNTGASVNLEKALRLNDRLGGHLVTGHIDGMGIVKTILSKDGYLTVTILVPAHLNRYFIKKGSVCIDGISLTVAEVHKDSISVAVIPHTYKATTLGLRKAGDKVNLEADIIGKYVEKYTNGITEGAERADSLGRAVAGLMSWSGGVSACN